jgi:glycine/D-amino acid oxidase-like deaminating enzyme
VYASSPDVAAFEIRTFNYLKDFIQGYNIPCDWESTTGTHGFYTKPLFDLAEAHLAKTKAEDPSLADAAAPIRPRSTCPSLADLGVSKAVGAMWQANAASLWPYKLVAWILMDLLTRFNWPAYGRDIEGFNLQTNTPVTHIQRLEGGSSSTPSWVVHTPRGQVATRCLLLATNAYTSHLLPEFSDLIVPVRGQVATLMLDKDKPNPELDHTYVFLAEGLDGHDMDDYLVQRPEPNQELVLGGGRHDALLPTVGVSNDDELDPAVSLHLKTILPRVLDLEPEDREAAGMRGGTMDSTYEWTGIMGYSRDGHPWVGRVPESVGGDQGLWICAGYTGHGMPQAVLCAKAVVEMMGGLDAGSVDVPRGFLVTEERIRTARILDEVEIADSRGIGLFRLGDS